MNQESLTDSQIDRLRSAAVKFFDQQIATGTTGTELSAAWLAVEEVGVAGGNVVIGIAKHLASQDRQRLYGPNVPNNNLDQQG